MIHKETVLDFLAEVVKINGQQPSVKRYLKEVLSLAYKSFELKGSWLVNSGNCLISRPNKISLPETLELTDETYFKEVNNEYWSIHALDDEIHHLVFKWKSNPGLDEHYLNLISITVATYLRKNLSKEQLEQLESSEPTVKNSAENTLKQSEENFNMLVQNLPAMVYTGNSKWQTVEVLNSEQVIGYSREFLMDRNFRWFNIIWEDDLKKTLEQAGNLTATNNSLVQCYRIKNRKGQELWVRDYKRAQFTEKGELSRLDGVLFNITESVRKEERYNKQKTNYQLLAENASNVVGLVDATGKLKYISPSCYDLTGYQAGYLSNIQRVWQLVKEDDAEKMRIQIKKDLDKKSLRSVFTHRTRTKTKSYKWTYSVIKYNYNVDKVLESIVFNAVSIQDIKGQNELLKKNNAWLMLALDAAGQISYEFDIATGKYNWSDNKLADKYKVSALTTFEQVIDNIHPDDVARIKQQHEMAIKGHISPPLDYRIVNNQKDIRHFRNYSKLIKDKYGKPKNLIGVVQDVTEKKEVDRQIEESELKFRMLAENVDEVIYLRSKRKLLYLSPAIKKLLEVDRIEEVNDPFSHEFIYHEDIEEVIGKLKDFYDEPLSIQFRIKTKREKIKWVWVKASSFKIASGEIRTVGLINDITGIKQLEEDLTHERNRAIRARRVRDDFLSMMSHQLKTPMNTILNFEKLFSGQLRNQLDKKQLRDFQESSQYLFKLLNDILYYSELISSENEVLMTHVDLRGIVDQILHEFELRAHVKNIKLHVLYGGDRFRISLNKDYVTNILKYLIENAIKYTDKGSVEIRFYNHHHVSNLTFEITDTGIGIDKKVLDAIYDPFFSTASHLKEHHGGTGLGLSIVNTLVHKLNGTIEVTSNQNSGTTFKVTLPIQEESYKDVFFLSTVAANYFLIKELYMSDGYKLSHVASWQELKTANIPESSQLIIDWDTLETDSAQLISAEHLFDTVFVVFSSRSKVPEPDVLPQSWVPVFLPADREAF